MQSSLLGAATSIMLNDTRPRDKHIVKEEKEEAEDRQRGRGRSSGHLSGRGEAGRCPLGGGIIIAHPQMRCTQNKTRRAKLCPRPRVFRVI